MVFRTGGRRASSAKITARQGKPPLQSKTHSRFQNPSRGFFLVGGMLNSTFAMASPTKKAEISFETAMERLEKIVEEMESGKMLLEDLLVRYEEGMKLVKVCQDRLAHAEQKIQIITRDHAGKTSVKDFAATEPPIASTVTDTMKENDDVRLF